MWLMLGPYRLCPQDPISTPWTGTRPRTGSLLQLPNVQPIIEQLYSATYWKPARGQCLLSTHRAGSGARGQEVVGDMGGWDPCAYFLWIPLSPEGCPESSEAVVQWVRVSCESTFHRL